MAEQQPTVERPSFQPRPGTGGLTARYLLWRLAEKVIVTPAGCWEWTGSRNRRGYGVLYIRNSDWPESGVLLHRLAYQVCVDLIPDGLCVLHRCDNPPCVRPDHLFAGTGLDNIEDKLAKGRQARGQAVRRNHGHLKGEAVVTSRLTASQVLEIRRRDAEGERPSSIRADFGLSNVHFDYIVRGKAWAHLPLAYSGSRNFRPCPRCGLAVSTRGGLFYDHVEACVGME